MGGEAACRSGEDEYLWGCHGSGAGTLAATASQHAGDHPCPGGDPAGRIDLLDYIMVIASGRESSSPDDDSQAQGQTLDKDYKVSLCKSNTHDDTNSCLRG